MSELATPAKLAAGSARAPVPFGKYLLLGLLARGGMAEVYRAKRLLPPGAKSSPDQSIPIVIEPPDDPMTALFAIKVMRPQLAKEPRFVEMFIREGKLAVLLDHINIVRTFEIGRIEGRYFIAMEHIAGKDMNQILRRCQESNQRIPVPHACYIAARICEGLHYAHTRTDHEGHPLNIVNRDVSPSNVRLSYFGEVKLLDFGIAQALLKFTSEIGVLKGKFSYMSPEQIRGMPVDARTDVFSTGIMLHEMLTTEKLFRGETEFALMEKVRRAEVLPPSRLNRRVPEALDRVVKKALARDSAERYGSSLELGQALDELVNHYRFSVTELQELLAGLFRADYEQEMEELAACRAAAVPVGLRRDEEQAAENQGHLPLSATIVTPSQPTSPLANQGMEPPLAAAKGEERAREEATVRLHRSESEEPLNDAPQSSALAPPLAAAPWWSRLWHFIRAQ